MTAPRTGGAQRKAYADFSPVGERACDVPGYRWMAMTILVPTWVGEPGVDVVKRELGIDT